MVTNIAIIGCGAIGAQIAQYVDSRKIPSCRLIALYDEDRQRLDSLYVKLLEKSVKLFDDFSDFVTSKNFGDVHLVIEAASINAVKAYASTLLKSEKDILIMSLGAFSDPVFYELIVDLMSKKGNRVYLPSGAIGGSDIIRTVRDYINEITLVTTKSNKSLRGAPYFQNNNIDVESIREKTIIFDGSAIEAIKEFPSNVNVSALISMAGIGFYRTKVVVCIDPTTEKNQHEIIVKWKYGEFSLKVQNDPSPDNPKTSYLAVLSAVECIRSITEKRFIIGS